MADKDYYKVLGVSREATQDEILKAYRKLARKYHPDLNPGDKQAERKFTEVQQAFDVLGNTEKREQYDRYGTAAFEGAGAGPRSRTYTWSTREGEPTGFEEFDLGEIFGDRFDFGEVFGRAGRRAAPRRGADVRAELTVPFRTAALGGDTEVQVARERTCSRCKGTGGEPGSGTQTCPECGGSGRQRLAPGPLGLAMPCARCNGRGQVPDRACAACAGQGVTSRADRIRVKIPPGVEDGSTIRLRGQGQSGSDGQQAGDLLIVVRVAPHPVFRREGRDLYVDLPITVGEAILGGKVDVPTLDGTVTITLPPGTPSGRKMRVRGKGIGGPRGGPPGDLYVETKIVVPPQADEKSKELIRNFEQRNPLDPRAELKRKV